MEKPFEEEKIPENERVYVIKINVWLNGELVDKIFIGNSMDEEAIRRVVLDSSRLKNEISGKFFDRQITYDRVTECVTVKITTTEKGEENGRKRL